VTEERPARSSQRLSAGTFVVLEGLDGAGTTTQLSRLAGALEARGLRVRTTSEPSHGPIGSLIRHALAHRLTLPTGEAISMGALALLFAADRLDHLEAEILPGLQRGDVVLCDRYVMSSLAYQGSFLPTEWVARINQFAIPPDLTLFLSVDVRTAAQRRLKRGAKAELFETDLRQRAVAKQYERAIRLYGRSAPVVRLNGRQSPAEVARQALKVILDVIEGKRRGTAKRQALDV
jgi:dTMP kinase